MLLCYEMDVAVPFQIRPIIRSRTFASTIVRVKFGHGYFKTYLHRLHVVNSPICKYGYKSEDLDHIFLDCPRYPQHKELVLICCSHFLRKSPAVYWHTIIIKCIGTLSISLYKLKLRFSRLDKKMVFRNKLTKNELQSVRLITDKKYG